MLSTLALLDGADEGGGAAPADLMALKAPMAAPHSHAGSQTTVRVATLVSHGGSEVASTTAVDSYRLLEVAETGELTALDVSEGSAAGGTPVCVSGTNLDASATVASNSSSSR